MKINYLLAFAILAHAQIQAQTLVTTQRVSKGIIYKKYTASGPNTVHVLQIDLTDPTIKLQATKSGNVINGAAQTVKAQAAGKDNNGQYHNVIGAINADFFNTTTFNPVNLMINDGQIQSSKDLNPKRSVFGISDTNNPFFALPAEFYQATRVSSGASMEIDKINGSRETNQLILYNQYKGGTTGTNSFGTELKLVLLNGQTWKANGTVQCSVALKQVLVGNMAFSAGQAVLSGNGLGKNYLDTFNQGDIVNLQLNVAGGVSNITQLVGGFPRILDNGANVAAQEILDEGGTASQNTTLNPRTGVAINQSETTMYMVVCDGSVVGNPGPSVGMSMASLANFMIFLGAYNGINLDGGGSSTLVANNVVKNVPIDDGIYGKEREVGSALLVWSATQLFDDFEVNEGRYAKTPAQGGSVGINGTTSTLDRIVSSSAYSGAAFERAVLTDNTSSTANWVVRLMSGDGVPSGNVSIQSTGTLSVWLKTSTANMAAGAPAKVYLRFDDSGATEETPGITIINDGQWHQYEFDLNYTGGTSISGGNGSLGTNVTLDAIILKQNNTASTWTVDFDEISHNPAGSGTSVSLMTAAKQEDLFMPLLSINQDNQELVSEPVLYPNPNNGLFTIDLSSYSIERFDYEILNLQNRTMIFGTGESGKEINLQELEQGIYAIKVKSGSFSKSFKLIIDK